MSPAAICGPSDRGSDSSHSSRSLSSKEGLPAERRCLLLLCTGAKSASNSVSTGTGVPGSCGRELSMESSTSSLKLALLVPAFRGSSPSSESWMASFCRRGMAGRGAGVCATGAVEDGASPSSTISTSSPEFWDAPCERRKRGELANWGPALRRGGRDKRKGDGV